MHVVPLFNLIRIPQTHRIPNELFHEEFEFQRSRAIQQPSAIDRRDAVRLDTRDSNSPSTDTYLKSSSPSSAPYPGQTSTVSGSRKHRNTQRPYPDQASTVSGLRTRHRKTQEPKFRKRIAHQDELDFDEDSMVRTVLSDGHSNRRGK